MSPTPARPDAPVGVHELLRGNATARRRKQERRRRERGRAPRRGVFGTIVQVIGELLLTAGVIVLLFVAWELWWTNISANNAQAEAVHTFSARLQGPVTPPANPQKDFGKPAVLAAQPAEGEVFGVVYIPRFGPDYSRPLVQGTTPAQLDTLGLGHYDGTALPGAIGNFAVAGHRQTHGAVLDAIDTLVPGDRIYVQTRDGYYTYVFRNLQIVLPDRRDVLDPVPTEPHATPTQRLLTMTSCNPRFGSSERIIAYSVMESWQPAGAGPPAAIANQVAVNRPAAAAERG
ncbi:class E sortase [Specibacter cremeus]|uniref:class E sortase n=1 Tax=Specibacter cremeus TaxID=1629051 RepID=UPI000F76A394|nr:class E sortase [Specibacter cremeus]